MKNEIQKRSFWPTAIIGYFGVVIVAIAIFITWAVRQDIDLVRKDYYAEEVRFQQQLDRVNRTRELKAEAVIIYDQQEQSITLKLPARSNAQRTLGRISFYRPSDASLDRNVRLSLNEGGIHVLDARGLQAGLWKLRVTWNSGGEDFYSEESIVISRGNS